MKKLFALMIGVLWIELALSQTLSYGLGFELNMTTMRQNAPKGIDDYSNPHKVGLGIAAFGQIGFKCNDIGIHLSPGLSILNTRSDYTSDSKMNFFDLSIMIGYSFSKKVRVSSGAEYKYLLSLIKKSDKQLVNSTISANHRNFIHPIVHFNYQIDHMWSLQIRFRYFLKDVFYSGAFNNLGDIVGPMEVIPYSFSIGTVCRFSKK